MREEMEKSLEKIKKEIGNLWRKTQILSNEKLEKVKNLAIKKFKELKKKNQFSETEKLEIAESIEEYIFSLMVESINENLGEIAFSIHSLLLEEKQGENKRDLIDEKKTRLLSLKNFLGKTDLEEAREIRNWIDDFIKANLEVN